MHEDGIKLRIKRYYPSEDRSEHVFYEIPFVDGLTVLEGLWYIVNNIDGSLAFRYSCRGAVCGSCAMKINGVIDLACHTQISSLLPGVIDIEPLPYFTVIKDLVVDMDSFFGKYRSVRECFADAGPGMQDIRQSPHERTAIEKSVTCILCAACHSACPLTAMDPEYLGPAALTAVQRFAFDTRSKTAIEKLSSIEGMASFAGCMKISRCSKVCPRYIEPSEQIDQIRSTVSSLPSYPAIATTDTVCCFCSTGCGLSVETRAGAGLQLTTSTDYPVNKGRACPKGWDALIPLAAEDRAKTPYLRTEGGKLEAVGWDSALEIFTEKFKKIQAEHGAESLAFLSTGQITVEEMALLGSIAKFGMGIAHGDGNTRQCMATAAVAYKQSFGFDAPPYTYQDFEESDVLIFVGANPFISHPIMWERVCLNKKNPVTVVIDPRSTETAKAATRHYAVKPKTDASLFYCLANILIERNAVDDDFVSEHTTGFHEYKDFVKKYTLRHSTEETGLKNDEILSIAKMIQDGKNVSFWWTMGVNQSQTGVRTAQAIINLSLLTGNIGRPGTGPNSITGQCNAMGSRLFSNTTSLLGGHDFSNPTHRKKISAALRIDESLIPESSGMAYDEIVDGIAEGTIKGLWIIATNPLHSWIDSSRLVKLLDNLEFLVVQDMYLTTETTRAAHLLLPAAGWGEKEGTFINSERRIAHVAKVAEPPGEALPDFDIFKRVAKQWGCADLFKDWKEPENVFRTLTQLSVDTPCDISGIDGYEMLESRGGIQWPFAAGNSPEENERRLFEDGAFFRPDRRAKFYFEDTKPLPEPVDDEFPYHLLTGRGTIAQWHTQTKTAKSPGLKKIYPEKIYVEIHPDDGKNLGIVENEDIVVSSRRGRLTAQAHLVYDVREGEIFIPMHYRETNRLTFPAFDPYSHQPSYKTCAVNIAPAAKSLPEAIET